MEEEKIILASREYEAEDVLAGAEPWKSVETKLVVSPGFFKHFWQGTGDPLVAGSAMGKAVKTDGSDAAAGDLLDGFMRNMVTVETEGSVQWPEGVITTSAVMTKVWIDMFIGLWAFVLAMIWVYRIEHRPGETVMACRSRT